MNPIKLSIIVPAYNSEKHIQRCIDSLLQQDLSPEAYEIIVVNDGSKDRTLDLLRTYESENPNVIVVDKPNGGVSTARNAGLDKARGEYIWFVDSDDFINTNILNGILEHAYKYNSDWVFIKFRVFRNGKVEPEIDFNPSYENVVFSGLEYVKEHWLVNSLVRHIFKKNLVENPSLRLDESLRYNEEHTFRDHLLRKVQRISYYFSNEIIYFCDVSASTLSQSFSDRAAFISIMEYLINYYRKTFTDFDKNKNSVDFYLQCHATGMIVGLVMGSSYGDSPENIANYNRSLQILHKYYDSRLASRKSRLFYTIMKLSRFNRKFIRRFYENYIHLANKVYLWRHRKDEKK